jgi:hypothetical protein
MVGISRLVIGICPAFDEYHVCAGAVSTHGGKMWKRKWAHGEEYLPESTEKDVPSSLYCNPFLLQLI